MELHSQTTTPVRIAGYLIHVSKRTYFVRDNGAGFDILLLA